MTDEDPTISVPPNSQQVPTAPTPTERPQNYELTVVSSQ